MQIELYKRRFVEGEIDFTCNYYREKMEERKIYVTGDIHGNFESLFFNMRQNIMKDCILIVAGDCGLGFHKPTCYIIILKKMNTWCKKNNVDIYLVRGNHDDPEYFNGKKQDVFNRAYSNITALTDYTFIIEGDINILVVGGGISIDRKLRQQEDAIRYNVMGRYDVNRTNYIPSYWEGEVPVYEEKMLDVIGGDVTHVITHTAPSWCNPTTKHGVDYWLKLDNQLENDINAERKTMDSVYEKLIANGCKIKQWVFGHFHMHSDLMLSTDGGNTVEFTGLNCIQNKFDIKELVA